MKKIPLKIHPSFWVVAALIGFFNSFSFTGTLIWIVVILVSVIIHELGHALTAVFFGLNPRIELIALGGLTYHRGENLPFWKQFIIVLNGPLFGFGLFLIAFALLRMQVVTTGLIKDTVVLFFWVNLIWTVLNLVPVMPLDGGQLLRIALEGFFGIKGFKYSLIIGMIIAGVLSLGFFVTQNFLIGALFFLFAFQSFDLWRKTKHLSQQDRNENLKTELEKAEEMMQMGQKKEALERLEAIRGEAKQGMIFELATQYCAFLSYDAGEVKKAYELLVGIKDSLSPEATCLLHKAAFEVEDYKLVAILAGFCYQTMPSAEVAMRNAYATARLSDSKSSVGWLETAFQEGVENLKEVVQEPAFDPIRNEPLFQSFLQKH